MSLMLILKIMVLVLWFGFVVCATITMDKEPTKTKKYLIGMIACVTVNWVLSLINFIVMSD